MSTPQDIHTANMMANSTDNMEQTTLDYFGRPIPPRVNHVWPEDENTPYFTIMGRHEYDIDSDEEYAYDSMFHQRAYLFQNLEGNTVNDNGTHPSKYVSS